MNTSGVFESPPYAEALQQVSCPFQTYLSAGKSKFKVSIPKHFLQCQLSQDRQYARRKFYFSHLRVTPDYFNSDAYLFDLDTAEDLAVKLDYEFALFYNFSLNLYPSPTLDLKKEEEPGLTGFLEKVNSFAVTVKPVGLERAPFFFDWIDLEFQRQLPQIERDPNLDEADVLREYMESNALDYYEEDFDEALHSTFLPASVRTIPHANKYLFPTKVGDNEQVLELLRVRLCVAPNTKVSFSSKRMLQLLGFAAEKRVSTRYVFINRDKENYQYFVAETEPFVDQRMESGKISVGPVSESFFVQRSISFSRREKTSNQDLFAGLRLYLDTMSKETNVTFGLTYSNTTGLFGFQFPSNPEIRVTMSGDPELFQRLGFGLVAEIDKNSVATVFKVGQKETAVRSKVLVFDTGHVVVTCQNTSSNLSSVSNNYFMASLLPMGVGYLELQPCKEDFPCVVPPPFEGGSGDSLALKCHLWKFDDAGVLVPFKWVTGGNISGVLRGKV